MRNVRMYIDDIRNPKGEFDVIVRDSYEAINHMNIHECPEFISFDHDLGGADTAMKVVKWMVEKDMDLPGWIPDNFTFFVHSANPVGAANITGYLNAYMGQR